MTAPNYKNLILSASTIFALTFGASHQAYADGLFLNHDLLSTLEKPLAIGLGQATITLSGSIEQVGTALFDEDYEFTTFNPTTIGEFEVDAEMQLPNAWTARVYYDGTYTTDFASITLKGDDRNNETYADDAAASLGGVWGTVVIGNIQSLVTDGVNREGGTGNAKLAYDGLLGNLNDLGVGYSGRFGPAVVYGLIDKDARVDAGVRWSRPLGNKDYSLAARASYGEFRPLGTAEDFDSIGFNLVTDLIYGSTLYDLTFGYENLSNDEIDVNRWYVSGGVQHKVGIITLSAEGHYGELDGNPEQSVAIGGKYDIARGLSANLGLNYSKADAVVNGITLEAGELRTASFSMKYSF